MIGALLWLILDAAGEENIGAPPRLERAVGTRPTGDSLRQGLLTNTFRTTQSAGEVGLTFQPNGEISISVNGIRLDSSRWQDSSDDPCLHLSQDLGGRQWHPVLWNGRQLLLFDLEGFAAFQFEATSRGEWRTHDTHPVSSCPAGFPVSSPGGRMRFAGVH